MHDDSKLQRLEMYTVAAVGALLIAGLVVVSKPVSLRDYGVTDVPTQSSSNSFPSSYQDSQPALLEPALRSLDGVAYHG